MADKKKDVVPKKTRRVAQMRFNKEKGRLETYYITIPVEPEKKVTDSSSN